MIEAVIFDIDGTIVDSVDLHTKAWQAAFEKYGKKSSFSEIRQQIGKGADQLMPVFLSKQELDDFGKELDQYRSELFKTKYLSRVKSFPKVRELFERIKKDGKKIVLASSAKEEELKFYKKITQIEDLIEDDTSSEDVERSKPHPDIFREALKAVGDVDPGRAIIIGDTIYDAQAAAKAKVNAIGLLCGGSTEDQLRQAGCVAIYLDPADLLSRYGESPLTGKE
jgi:beta-phosphoglucomutase-like phosphatase (HAD superfamily)